jgi:hypothetical protein
VKTFSLGKSQQMILLQVGMCLNLLNDVHNSELCQGMIGDDLPASQMA